jgi:hypothetical protein
MCVCWRGDGVPQPRNVLPSTRKSKQPPHALCCHTTHCMAAGRAPSTAHAHLRAACHAGINRNSRIWQVPGVAAGEDALAHALGPAPASHGADGEAAGPYQVRVTPVMSAGNQVLLTASECVWRAGRGAALAGV